MRPVGIVRKIDDLGRIVMPKEVRARLGWEAGQPLEVFMCTEGVFLRAYNPGASSRPPATQIESMDIR